MIRVPFVLVSAVHLVLLGIEADTAAAITKALLVPALLPVVAAARDVLPRRTLVLLVAGLVLSWVGDVTISTLVIGLSAFLLAHVAYVAMFTRTTAGRVHPWTVVYAVWFAVFVVVLWPDLGVLRPAVVAYGIVLGAMAAVSTRAGAVAAVGGLCFVASDSVLAFRLFTEHLPGPLFGVLVMVLYLAAQALIVDGTIRAATTRAAQQA